MSSPDQSGVIDGLQYAEPSYSSSAPPSDDEEKAADVRVPIPSVLAAEDAGHAAVQVTETGGKKKKVVEPEFFVMEAILSHLGPVRSQVDSGSRWMKRLKNLLINLEKVEFGYYKALAKVVEHEKSKIKEPDQETKEKIKRDKMPRNWNALLQLYNTVDRYAFLVNEHAGFVKCELVDDLEEVVKDNIVKIKAVYKDAESHIRTLNAQLVKVQKIKNKCSAAIKTRDQVVLKEKNLHDHKKRSLLSRISETLSQTPAQADAKVKTLKLQYEEAISHANDTKIKWEQEQLPQILKLMEKIERDRLRRMRDTGLKFADNIRKAGEEYQKIVENTNVDDDIASFVKSIKNEFGPSHFPEALRDEIINWEFSGDEEGAFATKTLAEIMESQKSTHPELIVPSTLVYLVSEIRRLDGFRQEGVFRIAARVDQVASARKQLLEKGTAEITDPYVAADLLKVFIRELPDSLFENNYPKCMELAKSEEASLDDYRAFWKDLSIALERRSLLQWLWDLLIEISQPTYTETSKMSLRNFAIVFAPNLLRPASDEEGDWITHIQNTPYESVFVHKLLLALSPDDVPLPPPDQDHPDLLQAQSSSGYSRQYQSVAEVKLQDQNQPKRYSRKEVKLALRESLDAAGVEFHVTNFKARRNSDED